MQKLRITLFASPNPTTALIITCTVDQVITVCAFSFTCEVNAYLAGRRGKAHKNTKNLTLLFDEKKYFNAKN